jgi:hypothetical protein
MVKTIYLLTLFVFISSAHASVGYLGEVKIISMDEQKFTVEQAGYRLEIKKDKLHSGMVKRWQKNIGKTIRSGIPYNSVAKESKIANYTAPTTNNR